MNKCLICYNRCADGDYHPHCARSFFQTQYPPKLPYGIGNFKELAKQEIQTSCATITGVQKKISLDIQKEGQTRRLTFVNVFGRFILKPPTDQYPLMPIVEHLSMCMAKNTGLDVVPHALIRLESGELAYMSRRVDRLPNGEKLHMEDMCQLTERLTEHKYNSSMENVAKAIKQYSSATMFNIVRFFEITIFSFLIGNADMHLKNFSLIYKGVEPIAFAPAYDLLSTRLLIPESVDPEEMALTLNGKKRKLNRKDFDQFGKNIGLPQKQIENVLSHMQEKMDRFYQLIHVSFLSKELQEDFIQLIQSRAKRLQS